MVQHILGKLKTLKRAEITEKVDLTPFSATEKAEFKIFKPIKPIAFQGVFSVFSSELLLPSHQKIISFMTACCFG